MKKPNKSEASYKIFNEIFEEEVEWVCSHDASGPVCKVVWFRDGKEYEKEYSQREHAIEKQKSLLIKKIPAIIKAC